jgi:hypothetical protein
MSHLDISTTISVRERPLIRDVVAESTKGQGAVSTLPRAKVHGFSLTED